MMLRKKFGSTFTRTEVRTLEVDSQFYWALIILSFDLAWLDPSDSRSSKKKEYNLKYKSKKKVKTDEKPFGKTEVIE